MTWAKMETAPRDGSNVDLWCIFCTFDDPPNAYEFRRTDCWWNGAFWVWYDEECGLEVPVERITSLGGSIRAVCWMPSPEPPARVSSETRRLLYREKVAI